MILRALRILECLRILREERDRYRDIVSGGALGDSDMPWPSIEPATETKPYDVETHERGGAGLPPRSAQTDATGAVERCHGSVHIAPGLFGCANCGAEWSGEP